MIKASALTVLLLFLVLVPGSPAIGESELMEGNRLIKESSPYLQEHAHDPVDWYPWGEEAFSKAKREDKPIFLSIGYSACHWCHVMRRESFSDEKVAKILNEHFVPVKVDREERPDIDNLYMNAVTAMTGSGGWPLTVFITADGKPFYGGTYFPVKDTYGLPGMTNLLTSVIEAWKNKRDDLVRSSELLLETISGKGEEPGEEKKDISEKDLKELLKVAYSNLIKKMDTRYGGIGEAPKFPMAYSVSFLLRYWKRTGSKEALKLAEKTLSEIAKGGITDQIGGGVHRYSTDRQWKIPHFEKMLYDQALLSRAYVEMYQVTGKKEYSVWARDILDYVMRELKSPSGGFYSSEDADSIYGDDAKEEEGAYYLWNKEEIIRILGADKGEMFSYRFGIEDAGNAMDNTNGEFKGKNVLHVAKDMDAVATRFKKDEDKINEELAASKNILGQERTKREHPRKDDKVLTDWNGLMISSLATGGRVLDEGRYIKAGEEAAVFLLENLVTEEGKVLHRYRNGESGIDGMIEDYAFLVQALLDLYETTFNVRYLKEAKSLTDKMIDLFWDDASGGFFFVSDEAEKLVFRNKEVYDGAVPSGNSVAVMDLARIAGFTTDEKYIKKAREVLKAFSGVLTRSPENYLEMMNSIDFVLGPDREIAVVQGEDGPLTGELLTEIHETYLPNKTLVLIPREEKEREDLENLVPWIAGKVSKEGISTVYVCRDRKCDRPVSEPVKLKEMLEAK
ncbi:MAG: thioredoxin domain-containing protein [Candidatus Aadella gelida]|nr:thioredoxin domain-containing protein [Candidatus Aadella gelida]